MIIHPHLLVHGDFTTHEKRVLANYQKHVVILFLTVPPYDPESQLGLSSLCRLEAATGMEVMMSIVERLGQFNTDFYSGDKLMALIGGTPPVGLTADKVKKIILQFLETMEPKTWRTLYSILNVLDMEGVVEDIESYLSSKCK